MGGGPAPKKLFVEAFNFPADPSQAVTFTIGRISGSATVTEALRSNPPLLSTPDGPTQPIMARGAQVLGTATVQHPAPITMGASLAGVQGAPSISTSCQLVLLTGAGDASSPVTSGSGPIKSESAVPHSRGASLSAGGALVIQPLDEPEDENDELDNLDEGDLLDPKEEEDEDDEAEEAEGKYDPSGFQISDLLNLHWGLFEQDHADVKLVRGSLLGLPEGQGPTREQVDESELFALCPPGGQGEEREGEDEDSETCGVADVHAHWLPILRERKAIADRPPEHFMPPVGLPKIYTAEGLRENIPQAIEKWLKKPLPSLIVLVSYTTNRVYLTHLLSSLHNIESLRRISIGSKSDRKQFACCPYCGVRTENQGSSYSHARKHLNYCLLCESCLSYHSFYTGQMQNHLEKCKAVVALRKASATSAQGSTPGGASQTHSSASSLKDAQRQNKKGKRSK